MKNIKKYRLLSSYTQADLAQKIGVSQSVYAAKETGRVKFSLEEAFILSQLFKVNIEELFKDML